MIIFDIDGIISTHFRKNFFENVLQILIMKSISKYYSQIEVLFLTSFSEIYRQEILKIISRYLNCSKNKIDLTMNPYKDLKFNVKFKEQVGYDLGFKNIKWVYGGDKRAANMWISHGTIWLPGVIKNWRYYK